MHLIGLPQAYQECLLRINGNCGDYLCGKSNHKNEGINDGLVIITGNAGDYAIQRMRRGVVIIKGNVGKILVQK